MIANGIRSKLLGCFILLLSLCGISEQDAQNQGGKAVASNPQTFFPELNSDSEIWCSSDFVYESGNHGKIVVVRDRKS